MSHITLEALLIGRECHEGPTAPSQEPTESFIFSVNSGTGGSIQGNYASLQVDNGQRNCHGPAAIELPQMMCCEQTSCFYKIYKSYVQFKRKLKMSFYSGIVIIIFFFRCMPGQKDS